MHTEFIEDDPGHLDFSNLGNYGYILKIAFQVF
jgi:hypothetical protein